MSEHGPDCYAMPICLVCHRPKPPLGRDVASAAAGGYCEYECPGNREEPRPGHLWPGEFCTSTNTRSADQGGDGQ